MMTRVPVAIFLLSLCAFASEAQQARELLRVVGDGQARRLEAYNSTFLQKQTYFASRYRIVSVDTNLLMQERDITITPFDDTKPIEFAWKETLRSGPDMVTWFGRPSDPALAGVPPALAGVPIETKISAHAWDLDESGKPLISAQNRFEFSPLWTIDANNRPLFRGRAGGPVLADTPPPQTAEQIERHRRLLRLNKHAFFSVSAVFNAPGESQYILLPLRFTPRYSVIYEVPSGTVIPVRIDRLPGEPEFRSTEERAMLERYREAMRRLPADNAKEIVGDIR